MVAMADPVEIDGIYYNLIPKGNGYFAEVTKKPSGYYFGSINIPSVVTYNGEEYSVTSIKGSAFYYCTGLTSVTIPNSVTSIGDWAFSDCSGLTSVHITDIAAWCNISFGSGHSNPLYYAHHLYMHGSEITDLVIPNSVTSIGASAFSYCTGLTSVIIGNSVTSIGDYAFNGCSGLTFIIIPNSVTSIGSYAFASCSNLNSVTIGSGVLSIGNRVFENHKPAKVIWLTNTPPNGYSYAAGTVNYVANNLYTSLSNKTVYPFLSSIFEVDGVKYVPVSPSERTCDAIDCAYDETEEIHIGKTVSYKGVSLAVKQIHPYAFYCNQNIKDVQLGLSGNIGNYAFQNCSSLLTATIGEQVTSIGNYTFSDCSKLQGIVVPNAVVSIGSYAFSGCSSMTEATIGDGVNTIGQYAFSGCSVLPLIKIPKAVTLIDNYVFSGCNSLKTVIMDDDEGEGAELQLGSNGSNPLFASCPLDSVYIGRNITYSTSSSYGYSPFYRNTSLRSVKITDFETEISENEFYGCTNLQNVYIGDGVTTIGNWAFSGCSSLDYFAFGTSVESIGQEAFSDCTAMTRIVSKAVTPPVCGSQALDDISKWTCKLLVPEGTLAAYQAADQWKEFFFTEEGEGSGDDPVIPEDKKCATPTIIYANGKVSFACETENVEFVPSAMLVGSTTYENGEMTLPTTYRISVYAKKDGYLDSDTAIKEVTVTGGLTGDVNQDGKVTITDAVKVVNIILNNGEATAPALQDEEEIKEPE